MAGLTACAVSRASCPGAAKWGEEPLSLKSAGASVQQNSRQEHKESWFPCLSFPPVKWTQSLLSVLSVSVAGGDQNLGGHARGCLCESLTHRP